MKEVNKKNIPLKYKVPLQGTMNKGIYSCFECRFDPVHRQSKYTVVEDIIGFADSIDGVMVVWECKNCGTKYFYHLRDWEETIKAHDIVVKYDEYVKTGKWEWR